MCGVWSGHSRGLALPEEDAGEGELQGGGHHLLGQGLELELDVGLRGHGTGILLHVDAAGGQSLPTPRRRLLWREGGERERETQGKETERIREKEKEQKKKWVSEIKTHFLFKTCIKNIL